jgi:tRNA threonylcarbamoyladenosine biosynthesis protein TsaB
VGSLEALAEAAGRERVVVCLDARMGQVYHAAFQREGHCWRQVCAPSLCDPDELPQLPPGDWFACGNGFERYPRILTGKYGSTIGNNKPGMVPRAKHVAILASRYFAAGRAVPGEEAVPMYVRNKVALTMNEQG